MYSDTSEETLSASDYTMDDSAVDMTKAGKYTIDFTYNADSSITGSYEITVTGGSTGNEKKVTITRTHTGTAISDQDSITETVSPITCLFEKSNSANGIYESSSQIRVYLDNKVTISGATIKKVVVTCSGDSYNKGFTASPAGTTSKSGATWTWEGSTSSLVLTSSGTSRITSIEVTYESSGGSGTGTDDTQTVESSDLGKASTTATAMDSEISYVNSDSNTYSNPMRIYSGNTFTISSKTKAITEVVYTCNSTAYATTLSNATFTVANGASTSVAVSGTKVTVTITGTTTSVAATLSAQVRLDALSVTYKK